MMSISEQTKPATEFSDSDVGETFAPYRAISRAAVISLALGIFVARDQVAWLPGLLVAAGTLLGVRLGVGFAHRVSPTVLKRILLVMVLAVCLAAAIKG